MSTAMLLARGERDSSFFEEHRRERRRSSRDQVERAGLQRHILAHSPPANHLISLQKEAHLS